MTTEDSTTVNRVRRILGGWRDADVASAVRDVAVLAGVSDLTELETRLRDRVEEEVAAIVEAIEECDAFDLLELMRLRELTVSPELGLDPSYDGSAAVLEVIALILLSRGSRHPSGVPRVQTEPHSVVAELHDRTKGLLGLGAIRAKAAQFLRGGDPLHRLSAEYQSYFVSVRALQYDSVQGRHERALFDRPEVDDMLREHLGFTYSEFDEIRSAIREEHSAGLTRCRDLTADIVMRTESAGRQPTEDEAAVFRKAMTDMMFLPADRAAFTVDDIRGRAGLAPSVIRAVLDQFALEFDSSIDATTRVVDFLHARNPVAQRGLLASNGEYLSISGPIGGDRFRQTIEAALKGTSAWKRYDATRCSVSEALAVAAIQRVLGTPPNWTSQMYFASAEGVDTEALDSTCSDLSSLGKQVESDALFVVDDVAICLEVKGRAVAEQARRGDVARLQTEIKNVIGDGARQARRLESLIKTNGGVWDGSGTWVDLSHIREVHTVVVGLDYLGPLGVALGDLAAGGFVGPSAHGVPWIVSLHDVEVISHVIDRPTEFLLYLRRRSRSLVADHDRGVDELDLFMLFLDGGLYIEDDPEEVHRRNPKTSPPSRTARQRHRDAAQPTLVATFTDPLDAWMYWFEGSSQVEVPKPTFVVEPGVGELVDFLADGRKPGWLRMGTDLLGLSGKAQERLLQALAHLRAKTAADGQSHDLAQGYASSDGYPTFFAATVPSGGDREPVADRLYVYMTAKKHQLASDRSLGLLLAESGRIEGVSYMNDVPTENSELDDLATAMGLWETWKRPKRHPSMSQKKRKRRKKQKGPADS